MRALAVAIFLMLAGSAPREPTLGQQPQKGWIGVTVVTVTPALRKANKLSSFGVLVTGIEAQSPAEGQLKTGDVISILNDQPVQTAEAFATAIEALAPGAKAQLSVARDLQILKLEITIASAPAPVTATGAYPAVGDPLLRLDTGGHQAIINGLTFTPNGKFIVAVGDDKLIRIWDWQSGKVVRTIRGQSGAGPEGQISALALSPDGRWLAVGGFMAPGHGIRDRDVGDIRLYDFASGELKTLLKGHGNVVLGVAFSPGSKHLISGSFDHDAIIWDVDEAKRLHRLKGHRDHIYAVGFTTDGARAVTGSDDKTLRLWNVADGALLKEMTGHGDKVFALAVSPKDGSIASGDDSGEIRLWDGTTGTFLKVLAKQGGQVGSLRFSPDGRLLLSASGYCSNCKRTQHIWDAASGKELTAYTKHDNTVRASAFSPDGRLAATGGGDNEEIHIWDPKTGEMKRVLKGTGQTIWATGFSADGKSIAWGTSHRSGRTINDRGPLEMALRLPGADETLAALLPVTSQEVWQRAMASLGGLSLQHRKGGNYGFYAILDILKDGKIVASIERGPTDGYAHRSYSFTHDGKTVISGGANGHLAAYGLDGIKIGDFIGHEGDVWAVAPSPDGRYLVSGAADQTVRLWNLKTRELIVTLFRGSDGQWVIYTPQGYYAASLGGAKLVTWQLNKGPEHAASVVSGDQLYRSLNRPALVAKAIALASAVEAIRQSKDEAGFKLSELLQDRAPAIHLIDRRNEEDKGRATVTLAFEPNILAITGIDFFVKGSKVDAREVKPANPLSKEGFALRAFDIPLAQGQNEIKIVARNKVGDSEALTDFIYHQGEGDLDTGGTLYLLAIGVNAYPGAHSAYYADLRYAVADATAFAETVKAQMAHQYLSVKTTLLVNGAGGASEPTKANIEAALKALDAGTDKDTVVIFLAGHGERNGDHYYFLPTDTVKGTGNGPGEGSNLLDWEAIERALTKGGGKHILFVDSCHSGGAYNTTLRQDAEHQGFVYFVATAATSATGSPPLAKEDSNLGHGYFTFAAIEGLKGKAEDRYDRTIRVTDLGPYIVKDVRRRSVNGQEPDYYSALGDIILVKH